MAGVDVGGGGKGGRKSLDSEINMIPMIDLLMVTISFLLITAVWTHMARLEADAQVQSQQQDPDKVDKPVVERILFVEMKPDKFTLTWKEGGVKVEPPGDLDVKRPADDPNAKVADYRCPNDPCLSNASATCTCLASAIEQQWKFNARTQDTKKDLAILHCDNQVEYKYVVGVMDAIYETKRVMGPGWASTDCLKNPSQKCESAFNVTFTSQ